MSRKNRKKKPIKKRTLFTILAMFNITWYTIIVLFAAFTDHEVQSDLTIAWFAAWTTELALLYGIKVHEKYNGDEPKEDCDDNGNESSSTIEDDAMYAGCKDQYFPEPQSENFDESPDDEA